MEAARWSSSAVRVTWSSTTVRRPGGRRSGRAHGPVVSRRQLLVHDGREPRHWSASRRAMVQEARPVDVLDGRPVHGRSELPELPPGGQHRTEPESRRHRQRQRTAYTPTAMGPTWATHDAYARVFTPLVELRLEGRYQITRAISFHAGWTGFWMDNIARANAVINYTGSRDGHRSVGQQQTERPHQRPDDRLRHQPVAGLGSSDLAASPRPERLKTTRLLLHPLAQFIQFRAQAMAQGAFRPKLVQQLLGLLEHLVGTPGTAEQASPGTGNLLFCQQSNTSCSYEQRSLC